MRGILILAFGLLLSACAASPGPQLSTRPPGLHVAKVALKAGSPQVALNITEEVLQREPRNAGALVVQGEALARLGHPAGARERFMQALAIDPRSVPALVGAGRASLAHEPAVAERFFLQATTLAPQDAVAWNDLGIARDMQGRHADAQTAYRQALGIAPGMTASQVNLGLSMAITGQAQDAVRLLRPLATRPGASRRVRDDYAVAATLAGDQDTARHVLEESMTPEEVDRALSGYRSLSAGAR